MKIKQNKLSRLTNLLKLVKTFIKSVISLLSLGRVSVNYNHHMFDIYARALLKEFSNKGPSQTIKLFKEYHRVGTCISLGASFEPVSRRRTIKGTHIPRDMGPLLGLLQGSTWDKRIGLTILNTYKLIRLPPSDDLSAITEVGPDLPQELVVSFNKFITGKIPEFLVREIKLDREQRFEHMGYITSSNGPNGPSLKNVHKDTLALIKDSSLYNKVYELLDLTSPNIAMNLDKWKEIVSKDPKFLEPNYNHSRISQLSEGGGKTRNIAIIDYWSQSALSWIHDNLMKQLRGIRVDATYSQEDGFKTVVKKANLSGMCFSFDLSSATDRFPLQLQTAVIKQMFGTRIGDLWEAVIARRKFKFRDKEVSWGRGQPLGALSSWAAFSLTHHLFMRWCANDPFFENYVILGDDVAIMDEAVAVVYHDRMNKFGVTINPNKGFIARDGKVFGEFAKRVFLKEDELSGIPIDLIISCCNSLYQIPDFIEFVIRRWNITLPGSELYAPECFSFLSRKGKHLLGIVMSFRNSLEAKSNLGYPWCSVEVNDEPLFKRVNRHYLTAFQNRISQFFDEGSKLRNELIKTRLIYPIAKAEGNHVSDMVSMSLKFRIHPLSILGIKLMGVLSNSEMDIESNLKNLDKLLVEFVPDVQFRSFFYDRKTVRNVTIGKTALTFYYEDIKKLTPPK